MSRLVCLFTLLLLCLATTADAAAATVFDGAVGCNVKSGQTRCGTGAFKRTDNRRSTVKSFDGVPIDVNFALPDPTTSPWGEGPYPLVMMFHGYSQGKADFPVMAGWLDRGYAVLSPTNRGFHESCGTAGAKAADPVCAERGYLRLDDTRYEVRDAQHLAGILVDEGLVIPDRIAAIGSSYGGGVSLALAALRDRVMLPDGSYAPWRSPDGTAMRLAVAAPDITWSDLAYSLLPNGDTLDYLADAPYGSRIGVLKEGLTFGLYFSGLINGEGYYAPPGSDPAADLESWVYTLNRGEPYGADVAGMLDELKAHHSAYYIDPSRPPAPLLLSAGFTDDLFPASETLRFYNRTRDRYPGAAVGLFLGPIGGESSHPRGQNKADVKAALASQRQLWLDHFLGAATPAPASEVRTFTQTCPDQAAAAGPFVTPDWASQSPGEIRQAETGAQTVEPDGGRREVAAQFKPGDGVLPCAQADGAVEPGTAWLELPPAPAGGFTVLGSPTVIADFDAPATGVSDGDQQIAARLVDVTADESVKTLVNRGLWRVESGHRQVFQLNPNGWRVEPGHRLRLELLPYEGGPLDSSSLLPNFSRPVNDRRPVTISNLELRVPVRDLPDSLDGLVRAPSPRVLPDRPGASVARGNEAIGGVPVTPAADPDDGTPSPDGDPPGKRPPATEGPVNERPGPGKLKPGLSLISAAGARVKGRTLTARFRCHAFHAGTGRCPAATVTFRGAPKGKKAKGKNVRLAAGTVKLKAGQTRVVKLKLTARARKLFRDTKKKVRKRGKVKVKRVKGLKKLRAQVTIAGKRAGYTTIKRNGRVR